jgi:hypothetical protein
MTQQSRSAADDYVGVNGRAGERTKSVRDPSRT